MISFLKVSRFNTAVAAQDPEGGHLLFNTATRALLRVDDDTFSVLRDMFLGGVRGLPEDYSPPIPEELDDNLISLLSDNGFLVPAGVDEVAELRKGFEDARRNQTLYYTIGLTMACNFDCPYCFEAHLPEHMDITTADQVHRFIMRKAHAAPAKSVFVNWFGGEPLLNLNVLTYLSKKLRASCQEMGAQYDSYVITNGALLNEDCAHQLVESGVSRAQVTIDGPAAIHDVRRYFKGGKASFARILENLKVARDIISLAIRINVDSENRPFIPELVRQLHDEGIFHGKREATIYASPIVPYTEQSRMLWKPLAQSDIVGLREGVEQGLQAIGMEHQGETTFALLGASRGGCSAMEHNSFVIGPKGHLFKCELGIHDHQEAVGRVSSDLEEPVRKRLPLLQALSRGEKSLAWDEYNPYDNATCSTCQFVPICKSGCPKKVMEGASDFMSATCAYWDQNFARLVHQAVSEGQS